MSTIVAGAECINIFNFRGYGFGDAFSKLKVFNKKQFNEFRGAESLGGIDGTLRALDEVFEECSQEGWDGYDARPISEETYNEARIFIESLPFTSSIPMPDIIPEPGGEIALEWSKGSRQVFVASVAGKNEIVYAGLFGINKTHGAEYFGDSLPAIIINNLKRLYF